MPQLPSSETLSGQPRRAAAIWLAAILVGVAVWASPARAQYLQSYVPRGVPGYGTERGVTVLSRERPSYEAEGVRVGSFVVRPMLGEATGYDSNVSGTGQGSWLVRTAPAVSAQSDWGRDRLGAALSLDSHIDLDQPRQSRTDWMATIGGGKTIDRNNLNLGYSHLSLHQTATELAAVASDTPVAFQVDDVRSDYTVDFGRLSFTPNVDFRYFTFAGTTVHGAPVPQSYRDRLVSQAGVTVRYSLSEQRNLLLVMTGLDSHYTKPQRGQLSNNSRSVLVLAGIDYLADGMFRYQLLAGGEVRIFAASAYGTHAAPIIEARAIWTPTGLTTVTGSVSREIEDPAAEGTGGYTYSIARIVIDHEYRRDLLLQGRGGVQVAQYLHGGGIQTSFSFGAGATWLVNRNLRASLEYDFTDQSGSGNSSARSTQTLNGLSSGGYARNLFLLALRLAL
jgi:hypothetical protein